MGHQVEWNALYGRRLTNEVLLVHIAIHGELLYLREKFRHDWLVMRSHVSLQGGDVLKLDNELVVPLALADEPRGPLAPWDFCDFVKHLVIDEIQLVRASIILDLGNSRVKGIGGIQSV